jgi:hypothetical protein
LHESWHCWHHRRPQKEKKLPPCKLKEIQVENNKFMADIMFGY